jgi:iron-sulfur cluster assembly protein
MERKMQFTVTDKAHNKLVEYGLGEDSFLRIGVKNGGCSGMTYDACIDDVVNPADRIVYQRDTVRIVAADDQEQLLDGLDIDFSDDLVQSGFRLSNRRNVRSCGCGQSFKPEEAAFSGC